MSGFRITIICVAIITLMLRSATFSQTPTTCTNSNFSLESFENWEGCYGSFNNPCQNQGFQTSGSSPMHSIISDTLATDPNTCNNLLKVFPGELHSARLGHDIGAANASELKFTFQVSGDPYYFVYRYAVVLQSPNHMPQQSPHFIIMITDSLGNIPDSVHGYHYFLPDPGLPGWQTCLAAGNTVWLDWSVDSINLSAYPGHTFTATFTASDCALGGHFGYGYITTYCKTSLTREWTGAHNELWNNPLNWDPAGVPSTLDHVIIPSTASVMPVVNVNGLICNDLYIGDEASLTIPSGIVLNINGDLLLGQPAPLRGESRLPDR